MYIQFNDLKKQWNSRYFPYYIFFLDILIQYINSVVSSETKKKFTRTQPTELHLYFSTPKTLKANLKSVSGKPQNSLLTRMKK